MLVVRLKDSTKPRVDKANHKTTEKESSLAASTSAQEKAEASTECTDQNGGQGEDTMKVLIDEANRMLRSFQQSDPKVKAVATRVTENKMAHLQKQLHDLKKAANFFVCQRSAALPAMDSLTMEPLILYVHLEKENASIISHELV
eukprot:s3631_g3.t1